MRYVFFLALLFAGVAHAQTPVPSPGCPLASTTCNYTGSATFGGTLGVTGAVTAGAGTYISGTATAGVPTTAASQVFSVDSLMNDPVTYEGYMNSIHAQVNLTTGNSTEVVLPFIVEFGLNPNQYTYIGPLDSQAGYFHGFVNNTLPVAGCTPSVNCPGYVEQINGINTYAGNAETGELGTAVDIRLHPADALLTGGTIDTHIGIQDAGSVPGTNASIANFVQGGNDEYSGFGTTSPIGMVHARGRDPVGTAANSTITGANLVLGGTPTAPIVQGCIVTGTGVASGTYITGPGNSSGGSLAYTVTPSGQSVTATTLTFTCHEPDFVAQNYTQYSHADYAFADAAANTLSGYIEQHADATYGHVMTIGLNGGSGHPLMSFTNQTGLPAGTMVGIGFPSGTYSYPSMFNVNGQGNFVQGIVGGLVPTAQLPTDLGQVTGGSLYLAFASVPGVAPGQIVQGTNIPANDTVASVVSTAQITFSPATQVNAGATVIPYAGAANNMIGMQVADATSGHGYIPASTLVIAPVVVGVSFTISNAVAGGNIVTSDVIRVDPVVTLATTTTTAVPASTVVTFATNHTSVSSAASLYTAGDLSVALNANIGGAATIGGNLAYLGTAPVVSACGTSPSIDGHATNNSGTVTVGSVAAASCTVTFAGGGYTSWNHCRVTPETALATFGYTYTRTAITVAATSLIGEVFDYGCDGQ